MSDNKIVEAVDVRVLFFIQDPRIIEMSTLQLEKMGYKLAFARTSIEAFAQVQNFKPQVILLSWNMKKLNVKGLYHHFTEKLRALVVVFSELNDPISIMKLNDSGIPSTLFPPLSGQGIHTRIQILLKKHDAEVSQLKKPDDLGFKSVAKEKLPSDTKWDRVTPPAKTDTDDNMILWKGTSTTSKNKLYFFESDLSPEQIFNDLRSGGKGASTVIVETDQQGESLLASVQQSLARTLMAIQGHAESASKKPHLSLLEKIVKSAIANLCPVTNENTAPITLVYKAAVIPIYTSRFKGYLTFTDAESAVEKDFTEKLYKKIKSELEENGEKLEEKMPLFDLDFRKINFVNWSKRKADFAVQGQLHKRDLLFSFVESERLPRITEVEKSDYYQTRAEDILVKDTHLTFDLYIYMPNNDKYLLYIKKRRSITQATIDKFLKFNVKNLYFKKDQRAEFYQYSAITCLELS